MNWSPHDLPVGICSKFIEREHRPVIVRGFSMILDNARYLAVVLDAPDNRETLNMT